MKLLLAEDENELLRALQTVLTHEGYEVDISHDGEEASGFVGRNVYDGCIFDVMMPKKTGIEVLQEMRENGNDVPVLLLTAKAEIEDRVDGLDAGADDYLTKPFAMKELLARVRSMTRRKNEYSGKELSLGNVTFNTESLELTGKNSIRLSGREAELLGYMMRNPAMDITTESILEHIWRDEKDEGKEAVWVYISFLRKKLEAVSADIMISGEKGGAFRLC